jgi:hypothetical protein
MDDQAVRGRAQALCAALVAGDIGRLREDLSEELRQNFGEVVTLLPLPARAATVESLDHRGTGYDVVLRLTGETDEVMILTRWKERDGQPTIIEASHLSRSESGAESGDSASEGQIGGENAPEEPR